MRRKELFTVVKATAKEFIEDDLAYLAAALTYYAFFSLFPLLILAIILAGIFLDEDGAAKLVYGPVGQLLPMTTETLREVLDEAFKRRANAGWLALVGVVMLLFTASGAFDALDKAINRAWNVEGSRSFLVGKLVSFVMMLSAGAFMVASFLVTVSLTYARTFTAMFVGRALGEQIIGQIANFLASIGLVFVVFLLMYRFLPRRHVSWGDVWPAALLAAIAWALVKEGFAYYLGSSLVNFEAVYGTLGAIIALLVWIYISSIIIVAGAEFSSQTAHVRALRHKMAEGLQEQRDSPWLPAREAGSVKREA